MRINLLFLFFHLPVALYAQHNHHVVDKNKTVVLTFDDACQSHYNFVAPLLKSNGFGATFYVCEIEPNFSDSSLYMNWRQMQAVSQMGFDIGNHTWHHYAVNSITPETLNTELSYIEQKCDSLKMHKPVSFGYPVFATDPMAIGVLEKHGYITARIGGDTPWNPAKDYPMYIPSYSINGTDTTLFYRALAQSTPDNIIVFTFHGVPDLEHPHVTTPPDVFKKYMQYLYDHHYRVISMRDVKLKRNKYHH